MYRAVSKSGALRRPAAQRRLQRPQPFGRTRERDRLVDVILRILGNQLGQPDRVHQARGDPSREPRAGAGDHWDADP